MCLHVVPDRNGCQIWQKTKNCQTNGLNSNLTEGALISKNTRNSKIHAALFSRKTKTDSAELSPSASFRLRFDSSVLCICVCMYALCRQTVSHRVDYPDSISRQTPNLRKHTHTHTRTMSTLATGGGQGQPKAANMSTHNRKSNQNIQVYLRVR